MRRYHSGAIGTSLHAARVAADRVTQLTGGAAPAAVKL